MKGGNYMQGFALLVAAGVAVWAITSLLEIAIKHIAAKARKAKNGAPHEESPL
jgi:hypothetical protein